MLLKYHCERSGCGVSGRRCTAPWIALIGTIKVFPTPKRRLRLQLPSCKGCIGCCCLSSTISIPVVCHISLVANIWTKGRSPLTLDSASLPTNWHSNRAGMHPAVDLKWLCRVVPVQWRTVSFVVAYAFSTLWTQCNEAYELLARHIEKTLPELLLHFTHCILHCWDDWNTDHDQRSLWSSQICWNTKQCDSVAQLLALQTTWPSHQGSWYLVAGC